MATAKLKTVRIPTVGSVIDSMDELREERRKLAAEDKTLKASYDALEKQLIEMLDAQGVDRSASKTCSASISETEEPVIEDWDALCAFAKKSGNMHLFQRRVSAPAWRELVGLKKAPLPGVGTFVKRSINLRVLSK